MNSTTHNFDTLDDLSTRLSLDAEDLVGAIADRARDLAAGMSAGRLRHLEEVASWLSELSPTESDLVRLWREYDSPRLVFGTTVTEGVVSCAISDVRRELEGAS